MKRGLERAESIERRIGARAFIYFEGDLLPFGLRSIRCREADRYGDGLIFKLGAMCVGGARVSVESAVAYAKQRKAFGKSISDFGLVREKIANMATLIYVGESLVYRTVGMMDALLSEIDSSSPDAAKEQRKAIEEYAVECSILKVWGSEMIDYVVDESLRRLLA